MPCDRGGGPVWLPVAITIALAFAAVVAVTLAIALAIAAWLLRSPTNAHAPSCSDTCASTH